MADAATIKAAMQRIMKEQAEKPNSGHRPPNLREGDEHENCANCVHWEAGFCKLYDYRTQESQTCDSWTPIPEGKT